MDDNIKADIKEIYFEVVGLIYLVQDEIQYRAVVRMIKNFRYFLKWRNIS